MLKALQKEQGPLDLLRLLKNRLDFIFYVLFDEASVYTVLEVTNSLGLPVDPLDKCKATLIRIAFEPLDRRVAEDSISELKLWGNIYRGEALQALAALGFPTRCCLGFML